MPTNISQFVAQGLDAVHVAFRNSSGWISGFADLAVTATNTGSGMRRMWGSLSAPIALPQREARPVRGDNGVIAQFLRDPGNPNAYLLELSVLDLDIEAALQGSTVYTLGEWDFGLMGMSQPTDRDTVLLLQRRAQSYEQASLNAPGWQNLIVLSNRLNGIDDDQFADDEVGGTRYNGVANRVNKVPWGAGLNSPFGKSDGITMKNFSDNPLMLHTWISDGTLTAIVVDYTPISVAKTKAFNAITGAALTVNAVTPGTKTVTLSASVTAQTPVVVVYEHTGY